MAVSLLLLPAVSVSEGAPASSWLAWASCDSCSQCHYMLSSYTAACLGGTQKQLGMVCVPVASGVLCSVL